jgi:hypothetical protein
MQKPGKNIFILESALTKKLPLEFAYGRPPGPGPTNVTPQIPDPATPGHLSIKNQNLADPPDGASLDVNSC